MILSYAQRLAIFSAPRPVIETERLRLRPIREDEAPRLALLAADRDVAATTISIPHPYPEGAAEIFIEQHEDSYREGKSVASAMARREDDLLIGAIGLKLQMEYAKGEMGYWLGVDYWGQGFAAEAALALTDWAFITLHLDKLYAVHFENNPASGRVMLKSGMTYEATLRKHVVKWGERLDLRFYGILREEWEAGRLSPASGETATENSDVAVP